MIQYYEHIVNVSNSQAKQVFASPGQNSIADSILSRPASFLRLFSADAKTDQQTLTTTSSAHTGTGSAESAW